MKIAVGDELPRLVRDLSLPRLVMYGAATWDFHRLHYAPQDGSRPIVDGQHFGGFLAKQALDWAGPQARVLKMSFRFAQPVFAGETVEVEGKVTAVHPEVDGRVVVEIAQTITCGERVVMRDAHLELSVPA